MGPGKSFSSDSIMNRRGGSIDQRHLADQELYNFALTTLEALIQREGFSDSSLSLICRLDISVMWNKGRLQYFVNEVERGACICLFASIPNFGTVERVADELGPHYVKWVRRRLVDIRH
jgi:hypothetical protein